MGVDVPPAPPEEFAQCVVSNESHVPLPPTQYLVAMFYPLVSESCANQLPLTYCVVVYKSKIIKF